MQIDSNNPTDSELKFILFISGMSLRSTHAMENLRKIMDQYLPDAKLEIVDINIYRQKAADYQIIAVPTLMRIYPLPVKMILGDLSETQKVLRILDIKPE